LIDALTWGDCVSQPSWVAVVRPFLKLLVKVVDFGATPEGAPVLAALKTLPELMGRKKVGPAEIDTELLAGSWRRLVLAAPNLEPGTVDWKAYVFCVLEQFHRPAGDLRKELLQVGRPAGEAAGR
jgi:hypothetical protein